MPAAAMRAASPGDPVVDAPRGPLRLDRGAVLRTAAGLGWQVRVHNPTSSRFAATLVLTIRNEDGRLAGSDTVSFEIGAGDSRELSRAVPELAAAQHAHSWRIESWVRVIEAPDRRALRRTS